MGDVVRHAIIPGSLKERCAYADVMMDGNCVKPDFMVTHNWSNLFRDLVAAIVADALDEAEFEEIIYLLENNFAHVEDLVRARNLGKRSYWVCLFCVNQHAGICGGNPHHSTDAVTGVEHPICQCGLEKAWSDTVPTLDDKQSIPCEMNKFYDMIEFLSSSNPNFSQVIAVDASLLLFKRAWCVAEIAAAHKVGMRQCLKIKSSQLLKQHEEQLRHLRVEQMEATCKQDKQLILAKIPDPAAFNRDLQSLLFSDLLPAWNNMDVADQMHRVGHVISWHYSKTTTERTLSSGRGEFSTPSITQLRDIAV